MKKLIAIFTLTILISSLVVADNLSDAEEAYDSGDLVTAAKLFRVGADQGIADDQYNLGVIYENGEGIHQDKAEAVKWYRKAVDQGHANAQYNLGVMYDNGEGVGQDKVEAVKWYRKAADQGGCNCSI